MLAGMTEAELDQYFSKVTLKRLTENTITGPNELKSHLIMVAKEGVAYDDEDQFIGIRNVAAPIKDANGRVCAAVGVLAPTVRLTRAKMREIAPQVKLCAEEISKALGYVCHTEPTVKTPKARKQKVAIT